MANGVGLSDGVVLGVASEGENALLLRLSSAEREVREVSCLTEDCSFSGTVSPALHLDNSASYLQV